MFALVALRVVPSETWLIGVVDCSCAQEAAEKEIRTRKMRLVFAIMGGNGNLSATMGRLGILILICVPACARGASEQNLLSALGEMRAAQIDHDRKNDAGFLAHALAAVRESPGHPFARYTLACAYGRAGRAAEAVAELDRLAARDIVFDVDHDGDFDPIRRAPAFEALRIRLGAIRARRVERSRVAFGLAARDLLTEGIAHDRSEEHT